MEHIYFIQATEEQFTKMMTFLDVALKKQGIEVLQDVVDIYNVLVSANKVALAPSTPEEIKVDEEVETKNG